MQIVRLDIPEVIVLTPGRICDDRGFFSETYNKASMGDAGAAGDFIQDNHSLSKDKGTVRGLHFQTGDFAQAKLVRVTRGAILDIAVDIRHGSPTFGKHVRAHISAENWNQIFIPTGFAHGFCTLTAETEVIYKVTAPYSPDNNHGLLWCDPQLEIEWPVTPDQAILSDKDRKHPCLQDLPDYFFYG